MIKTGIIGASGRMGKQNALAVHQHPRLELTCVVERPGHPHGGQSYGEIVGDNSIDLTLGDSIATLCEQSEVVVDFTHPKATMMLLKEAVATHTPLVIGTTGFSPEEIKEIESAAQEISLVCSGNFSTGINLLMGLVKKSAQTLSPEYNIEIMEQHHRQKVDAPSGTAIMLGKAAAQGRGVDYPQVCVTGREGEVGKRPADEIGVFALRGGGVVGHHTVYFMGPHDKIELTHVAGDRRAFSSGVVTACQWVVKQGAGRYDMLDVLNLK